MRITPLLTFALLSVSSYAQTQISIVNANFEDLNLPCAPSGNCYEEYIPGWAPEWFNNGGYGTFKPGPAQFPDGVPGGLNVGYIGSSELIPGGIYQTLSARLQANTTYTLQLIIGQRIDEAYTGYVATILAGGIPMVSGGTANPAPGTFVPDSITFTTDAKPAELGQHLAIALKSLGVGQADLGPITLTSTPAQ
jgi:hypothetical protein